MIFFREIFFLARVSLFSVVRFFSLRSLCLSFFFSLSILIYLCRDRVEQVPDGLFAPRLRDAGGDEDLHEGLAGLAVADGLPVEGFIEFFVRLFF